MQWMRLHVGHISYRGYKYCDVMRDGASQMIYCNFTKSRGAEDIVNVVALHHTKRTCMCTCITLSTLHGLQTVDFIEGHVYKDM